MDILNYLKRIRHISGEGESFIEKRIRHIREICANEDNTVKAGTIKKVLVALFVISIMSGIFLNSGIVAVAMLLSLAIIPVSIIESSIERNVIRKDKDLVILLSNINAEYIKEDVDFLRAVALSLSVTPESLVKPFKTFYDTLTYYSPDDATQAFRRLEESIDNHFFSQYIQLVRLCEGGESYLKYTLMSIPDELESHIEINEEFSFSIEKLNTSFYMTFSALPVMILFLKMVSQDYFDVLTTTLIGKGLMVCLIFEFFGAYCLLKRLNSPVYF
jgi:Flp pilus assembly protein TadB